MQNTNNAAYEATRRENDRRMWDSKVSGARNYRAWEAAANKEIAAEADALGFAKGSPERTSFIRATFQAARKVYNESVRPAAHAAFRASEVA